MIAAFLGLDTEKNEQVDLVRQLSGVGLATLMPYGHLRFHPALAPALSRELDGDGRDRLSAAWRKGMEGFLRFLKKLHFNKPEVAATLTLLDLPNLLAVVEDPSAGAVPDRVVKLTTDLEGLLQNLDRPRALARVVTVREAAAGALEGWSHALYIASAAAIQRLLDGGRCTEAAHAAERLVKKGLAAGENASAVTAYDLASAHGLLGRSLQRSGAAQASIEYLQEALRRFENLADSGDHDAAVLASVMLSELGDCLQELGRYDHAARKYEESIDRAEELGRLRGVAVSKFQLGTVRLKQGRYPEALEVYAKVRETFERLGESGSVAVAWHWIGVAHSQTGDYEAAEDAFRKSLKLRVERGDRADEASSLNQLGLLFAERGRSEEAVRFCVQAAEIYRELDDRASEGRVRDNAANNLLRLGRHDEARWELDRAIECKAP